MKSKLRSLTVIAIIFSLFFVILPSVSAKTRQSYLVDFLYHNYNENRRFGNNFEDTFYALEIINHYNLYSIPVLFGTEVKIDKPTFIDNLKTDLEELFEDNGVNLYVLFYILSCLNILNGLESLDSNIRHKINEYVNQTVQPSGGFSITNSSKVANLISTFMAYKVYGLLGEPIINETTHINWILSCNNTDGGYGANQTLPSTISTTYYATYLIYEFSSILVNESATLNYLTSFYCSDSYDKVNYGGYFPNQVSDNTLLSSTYYCVKSIDLIDNSKLHPDSTTNWILGHQNFQDGGFIENPSAQGQESSSIAASYYAFKSLQILNALSYLDQDVFMVEFNYTILIIVLAIIGIIAVVIAFIWKKRKI
ncbi:MAG: prenyltransferase/squalene oxidase repeat-containing protein [Promethearchaeota archaeon]